MRTLRPLLTAILSIGVWAAPLAGEAQPALEQFRFDPPRLCFRDTFRWEFSYRGLPGGLAAVRDLEMRGLWEGPGEQPIRSVLTPTREDLQRYTADHGRFESRREHWGSLRKVPVGGAEIRYTLRVVLADGQEVSSATTSVRYMDSCPPPALYTTLAAGPTGRIGFHAARPTIPEFLQGIRPPATSLIWGDLELPPGPAERSPAVVLVHGSISESAAQPSATFPLTLFLTADPVGTHHSVWRPGPPSAPPALPPLRPWNTPSRRTSCPLPASSRFVGAISSPSQRQDGYLGGCRNQRSSFRELMEPPRLSPVDETARRPSVRDSTPLCSRSSTSLRPDAGPPPRWPLRDPYAGRAARRGD
jgi:hypothetical protein